MLGFNILLTILGRHDPQIRGGVALLQKCSTCLDVSENSGTPKSSILVGFSIINHPSWGTAIFGNTQCHNRMFALLISMGKTSQVCQQFCFRRSDRIWEPKVGITVGWPYGTYGFWSQHMLFFCLELLGAWGVSSFHHFVLSPIRILRFLSATPTPTPRPYPLPTPSTPPPSSFWARVCNVPQGVGEISAFSAAQKCCKSIIVWRLF